MVKAVFGIFLLLCSLGLSARALPPSGSPGTDAVAQDATGTVWALAVYNTSGSLRRWQAGTWVVETIPGAAGFQPLTLTRGDDGSVYVFWRMPQGQPQSSQRLVTVHRGLASHVLARIPNAANTETEPKIYADAGGDVWISHNQPFLWHISPQGSLTTFPLKPEEYFDGQQPQQDYSPTLASLIDGAGRRWFYQRRTNLGQQNHLRGVLIWDGRTLDYHPALSGVPNRPFSMIAPLDATHVWLATADDYSPHPAGRSALYRVDTRTLSGVAEALPPLAAYHNFVQVFQAGAEWYVLEQASSGQAGTLWRKRGGEWHKCQDNLEEIGGNYSSDGRHPWLSEPSGLWLGVSGGAWWLPRTDQPALWVNWRRGLPVFNVNGLFPMADGRFLAVDPQGGTAEMPPTPQPVRPLPPGVITGGMGAPKYLQPLFSDPRQHLWAAHTFYTSSPSLEEWDGRQWRTHPVPKSIIAANYFSACDTRGRIWLTTTNWQPPTHPQPVEGRAVYDPAHDTWTNYATIQDALQASAALPGMKFLPNHNTYQPPVFSGDGRVAYAASTTIFLYDGHVWKQWQSSDILRDHGGNQPAQLHFNQDGHLELTLDVQICEWTPESGWKRIGEQKPEHYVDPVPPGGPHGLWATPAVDSQGGKWFVWQDAVYTARDGLWAKQEELSGPGSPFRYGYGIEDVLRDPVGRFFFVSRPAGQYDFVVWSPPPVPRPTLSLVPAADDAVTIRIQTTLRGPHWFLWRLNGSAWSAPQTTDTVTLTTLPHGDYRVEVQALDQHLLAAKTPAVAVFSIRVAPAAQIAGWVRALLHGTDSEREAAVAGLKKQPDLALPALRAARPGASDAALWWLDAATQQIMDQNQSAAGVKQ